MISSINDIDIEDALIGSRSMESRLHEFIQLNFPELLDYIIFSFCKQDNEEAIIQDICRYTEGIPEILDNKRNSFFESSRKKHSNRE